MSVRLLGTCTLRVIDALTAVNSVMVAGTAWGVSGDLVSRVGIPGFLNGLWES